MSQPIKNGNYYILIEFHGHGFSGQKQWEIANIYNGHICWLQNTPKNISLKEIIDKKTPIIKIPEVNKLKEMHYVYEKNL